MLPRPAENYDALMPPQCNIDARGKQLRFRLGAILVALGLVLCFAWALTLGGPVAWGATGLCLAGGVLLLYEARTGWCVLRAIGVKTPI